MSQIFVGKETIYKMVESESDDDPPNTWVLMGMALDGKNVCNPADKRKWWPISERDIKGDPEMQEAWKALE